ncbi:MAG: hypothetical protein SFU25_06520 [Candidatus Caenarcaniphilales bacterium]|nr:hypothetical protein [Candidatus Caenarcaniphilales bacterium]
MDKIHWQTNVIILGILISLGIAVVYSFLDTILDKLKIPTGRGDLINNIIKSLAGCFLFIFLLKVFPEWRGMLFS